MTASQRGKNSPRLAEHLKDSDKPYHARSMSWAQRLKRVFNIDITECEACEKTNVKIIACITEPAGFIWSKKGAFKLPYSESKN